MNDIVLQGIACRFGEVIDDGTKLLYLKPGCLTEAAEVKLLIDHRGKGLATTDDALQIHIGEKFLAFRYSIPDSWSEKFSESADDVDCYVPVSVGFSVDKSEMMTIEGVAVKVITEATLNEISITSSAPAVKTTYARVMSAETCGTLVDDSERLELIGRYINIHRKAKAAENGGVVEYAHATSPYDRASDLFTKALAALL
jgi:phage head maturation protease